MIHIVVTHVPNRDSKHPISAFFHHQSDAHVSLHLIYHRVMTLLSAFMKAFYQSSSVSPLYFSPQQNKTKNKQNVSGTQKVGHWLCTICWLQSFWGTDHMFSCGIDIKCWCIENSEIIKKWHNEHYGVLNHQHHDCLFIPLFKVQIKENIKAPRHWPLGWEFTGYRRIPRTNGQ